MGNSSPIPAFQNIVIPYALAYFSVRWVVAAKKSPKERMFVDCWCE